jgi:dynein heavy chain
VIRVLEQASNRHESDAFHEFDSQLKELSKLHIEAKDNVKFLSTLERHFKSISQGTLHEIADTIPPMMGAIRMVWVISRHYNTDERMVPLMERIAFELAERVAAELDVKHVFRSAPTPIGHPSTLDGQIHLCVENARSVHFFCLIVAKKCLVQRSV